MPMKLLTSAQERLQNLWENWPVEWPNKEYSNCWWEDITQKQCDAFGQLIKKKAGEREIEEFLKDNRSVLAFTIRLFNTGYHMSWIFPKRHIKPGSSDDDGGLIPDYLLAGAHSGGISWFVLELKGADKPAFNKRGKKISLSVHTNQGICQLLDYMNWASIQQAFLRDGLSLTGFRDSKGLLLIGTDEETLNPRVRDFKGAWNERVPNLQIRSYSAIHRIMMSHLAHKHPASLSHNV